MYLPCISQVHLEICQKVAINSSQRQTWNSQSQRLRDGQGSGFAPSSPPRHSASSRRLNATNDRWRASHTPSDAFHV